MKPVLMGAVMGAMMLWMLHNLFTGESGLAGPALLGFILAHVIIAAIVITFALFAARLSPRMKALLDRLHRPQPRHFAVMLGAALLTAATAHLFYHGVLA